MTAALLLVDLQGDFLAADGLQPGPATLVRQASALLRQCRERQIPVIHIWTTVTRDHPRRLPHWKKSGRPLCVAGTAGHKPPPELAPVRAETIVHKTGFNGFTGGKLAATLKKLRCDTVIIAGVHLHACVRALATEILERGLVAYIAEDAVASNDPIFAAATRRWLAARCVEFLPGQEILARLSGAAPSKLKHWSPRDPAKVLFAVPVAGPREIAVATAAARKEWEKWRRSKMDFRCRLLLKAVTLLEAARPKLVRQMALELGKPVSQGTEEVRRAAASVRDVIRRAKAFEFSKLEAAGIVRHEPLGIIALISPWNNPVAIPLGKIAPALLYGNTVLWKPAPAAAKISAALLKLLRAAGVPRDAVKIVSGDHGTAQSLAAHPQVDAVTITGSAAAGHAIQEICARRFLPLQAELSGNNAAIVWDDADLPAAAAQIAWGAFGFAGQRCTANRRAIVSAAIYESFWQELKVAAGKLKWGDPLDPATDIGPVIHAGKAEEHRALIRLAHDSGAAHRVEFVFPDPVAGFPSKPATFAPPVIIGCDRPAHSLVQEETMSPLLIVQRARTFAEAVALCNGVRHGLVAALFSRSAKLQKQFLADARAGMLKINSATAGVDVTLPFGGWKMSGLGPPEHGDGDRLFYTRMQAVYPGPAGGKAI
jgi:acyl-CoA reductase-like NAD-dependent aldehyde dehydrogenase/nicotinamidase-related amidase